MISKIIFTAALIVCCGQSFAQTGSLIAKVVSTAVLDNTHGSCMAKLDKPINTARNSPNCPGNWVTFSCTGTYNSKDIAYHKLDIAQKSEVTQDNIQVYVNDAKKHNGICYATRVDSKKSTK